MPKPPSAPPEKAQAGVIAVDPIRSPDWDSLLERHPQSTIFHGAAWARVLEETYGHRPFYIVRFNGRDLEGLLPIMEVSSRLTGTRGVSLPFSDMAPPLGSAQREGGPFYEKALDLGRRLGWKYLECRGHGGAWGGATPSLSFYSHSIDLSLGEKTAQLGMEASVRRAVQKAEEEGVCVDFGTAEESMRSYYDLHCQTRRRHGLPPQPFRFFQSIQHHILGEGKGFIATARVRSKTLAAAVFFYHGRQAFYKFGASNYAYQQLRPNNLVMWKAIKLCCERGLTTLHLGRTSMSNEGLRRFKMGFGAAEQEIHYARYDFETKQFVRDTDRVEGWYNRVFNFTPLPVLRMAGSILYPHLS